MEIDLSGNDAWNCWSLVTENTIYPSILCDSNAPNKAVGQDGIE